MLTQFCKTSITHQLIYGHRTKLPSETSRTVEDLTQPAGVQTLVRVPKNQVVQNEPSALVTSIGTGREVGAAKNVGRGFITSSTCPFSCAQAGVPKDFCVERQNGNSCEVEDMRQGPGFQTLMRVPR